MNNNVNELAEGFYSEMVKYKDRTVDDLYNIISSCNLVLLLNENVDYLKESQIIKAKALKLAAQKRIKDLLN
jgi:hypothetical protein